MEKFVNKVAVVTGSSSGIGVGICEELVKHGVIVVGLARRIEKLKEVANELNADGKYAGKFHPLKCDVTSEQEIENSFKWITSKIGPITILVNNAGIMGQSLLTEATGDIISRVYDTNVKAPILCAKLAIQNMTENSINGHIINVCSIAAHFYPSMTRHPDYWQIYTSSKRALKVISEALRRELFAKKLDIKVTNLSPGLVSSEVIKESIATRNRVFLSQEILQPKDVADACVFTLSTPPDVLISEIIMLPIRQKL